MVKNLRIAGSVSALLVHLIATACSTHVSPGDSETHWLACKTAQDCPDGRACESGRCAAGSDGSVAVTGTGAGGTEASRSDASAAGGAPAVGSDAGVRGSAGGAGGAGGTGTSGAACNGGAYGYPWGGGIGSGGGPSLQPSAGCVLDSTGAAGASFDDVCSRVRCPAHAADLVVGLDCTVPTTDTNGITLVTGCGLDTVQFADAGVVYEATFDPAQAGPLTVRTEEEYAFPVGVCTWKAFRAGSPRPACASEVRHQCKRPAPPPGAAVDCREPAQDGCNVCCKPYANGSLAGCNVSTTDGPGGRYDVSGSIDGPCACNCRRCADCTTELEQRLRTEPDMPQCHCPPTGSGGSAGTGGTTSAGGSASTDPCEAYCVNSSALARACPDVKR
jgi:hypothetical protein